MKAIANIDSKLGIGHEGELQTRIPADMRFFKEETLAKSVIMGRKTLMSFPGMKPLKGRINIVVTRDSSSVPAESIAAADFYADMNATGPDTASMGRLRDIARVNQALAARGGDMSALKTALISVGGKAGVWEAVGLIYGERGSDDAYIIGGESIYREFIDDCDTLILTENDSDLPADAYFPDFKSDPHWTLTDEGAEGEYEGIHYRFNTYKRYEYYMLDKPRGMSTSAADTRGTGVSAGGILSERLGRELIPLKRLAKDTEGLVIFSDDLALAGRLKSHAGAPEETYYIELSAPPGEDPAGLILSRAAIVREDAGAGDDSAGAWRGDSGPGPGDAGSGISEVTELSDTSIFMTGRRMSSAGIRRMIGAAGYRAVRLRSVTYASIAVDPELNPGEYRALSDDEIRRLKGGPGY